MGSIQALDSTMALFGTACGPLYIQTMRELTGEYNTVFLTLTVMPCVTGVLSLVLLRKPEKPRR